MVLAGTDKKMLLGTSYLSEKWKFQFAKIEYTGIISFICHLVGSFEVTNGFFEKVKFVTKSSKKF